MRLNLEKTNIYLKNPHIVNISSHFTIILKIAPNSSHFTIIQTFTPKCHLYLINPLLMFKTRNIESLLAWDPLKGDRKRIDSHLVCVSRLWLKPFKGGYSRKRRVVINLNCIYNDMILVIFNTYTWTRILQIKLNMIKSEPIVSDKI